MEEKCSELEEKAARLKEENARLKAAQSGTMARLIMENSQKDEIIARLKEEVLQKNQEIAQQKAELAQQDKKLEDAIGEALKKEELSDQIQQTLDQTQANLNDTSESYALHVARIYGKSSEKRNHKSQKNKNSDSERSDASDPEAENSEKLDRKRSTSQKSTDTHKRRPSSKKAKVSLADLIRKGIVKVTVHLHTVEGEDRICSHCGTEMVPMGNVHQHFEVEVHIHAKVIDHRVEKVVCPHCKEQAKNTREPDSELNLTPVCAQGHIPLLDGSWASPNLMAAAIVLKSDHMMAVNWQTEVFREFDCGYFPATSSFNTWMIKTAHIYLAPLYKAMKRYLLEAPALHADETRLQVINESLNRRKSVSFLWQYLTPAGYEYPVVLFEYTPGRSGDYCAEFLKDFKGNVLIVDAYSGYNKVPVIKAFCWSHARRKFLEAELASRKATVKTESGKVIEAIDKIFAVERTIQEEDCAIEGVVEKRRLLIIPLFEEVDSLIEEIKGKGLSSQRLRRFCGYF